MSNIDRKNDHGLERKWIARSLALNAAAERLFDSMQESVDTYSHVLEKENGFLGVYTADVILSSLLLLNISAESIVKAKIIKEKNGKKSLKKFRSRHESVVSYAKKAKITLSQEEEEVLNSLHSLSSCGFSPDMEKNESQIIGHIASHYTKMEMYFTTVRSFLFRVCRLMAFEFRSPLPARLA
ncbi:hypothetical protein [Pseudobacteriovorax antillogorgiicola]|uniref:Uncharacterized protein n=1 Tax=Pseudobacteriovorax antillogorgiicola TaxID=1513793 RepID=A0A1Y6B630_9BACT|nr:hypothetical protein [Pseudobacteriovorax antillogorgiicola]TCS58841.1 hypothetical protein EDD56_102356 [Pseudobacteriovorax antillogorgiicola]SME94081.1 hypothetical protein SAMN06296036_10287 [Pseudobacteriovorax antillogorgiicola]